MTTHCTVPARRGWTCLRFFAERVRLLRAAGRMQVPWRNGGGVTAEIAAEAGGGWRVSVATIDRPGPFSPHPGMRRSLAVVAGGPVHLTVAGEWSETLDGACAPFGFDGEEAVTAAFDGPARVINTMTERTRFTHGMHRLAPGRIAAEEDVLMLVGTSNYAWTGGLLGQLDALLLDPGEAVTIAHGAGVAIRITARPETWKGAPVARHPLRSLGDSLSALPGPWHLRDIAG